jgi:type IV secretion system protein VirD4
MPTRTELVDMPKNDRLIGAWISIDAGRGSVWLPHLHRGSGERLMKRAWTAGLMAAGAAAGASFAWAQGMSMLHLLQMAAMGFAAGGLACGVIRRLGPPRVEPGSKNRWASEAALECAGLLEGTGIVLGRTGKRYVTLARPGHALVIGGTRSGKTSGVIIPTLLNWTGSVLVFDPKGELWDRTSGWRSSFSNCLRFDPASPSSIRYNPLLAVRKGPFEVGDAQKIVEIIANPGKIDQSPSNPFWRDMASQWLTAVVLHVLYAESDKTIERMRSVALDFAVTLEAMRSVHHKDAAPHPECARVAGSMLEMDEKTRSNIRSTAESWLTLWADQMVAHATSTSDFEMGDLMCGERPMSLYLSSPLSEQSRLEAMVRIVLRQMTAALTADLTRDARGRQKRHDLLLCLEEFPQLGRLKFMEQLLAAGAGYGIRALMAAQSTNQLVEAYGRDHSILSNLEVFLAIPSVDTGENERIAEMIGKSLEYRASYSRKAGTLEGSTTWSEQIRRIMETDEIRALATDRIFMFTRSLRPVLLDRAHDDDPPIKRHKLPAAEQGTSLRPAGDWCDCMMPVTDQKAVPDERQASDHREISAQPDRIEPLTIRPSGSPDASIESGIEPWKQYLIG